jgi:hypothetical protein
MKKKSLIFYTHLAHHFGLISEENKEEIAKKNGWVYKKNKNSK